MHAFICESICSQNDKEVDRLKADILRSFISKDSILKTSKLYFSRVLLQSLVYMLRINRVVDSQVRSDVTRYRYGDEQHLEEALKRIFRYGQVPIMFSELVAFVLDYDESSLYLGSDCTVTERKNLLLVGNYFCQNLESNSGLLNYLVVLHVPLN